MAITIPEELVPVRAAALRAIGPIRPAGGSGAAGSQLLFTAQRTKAGRQLPPYHLVYFLLVDLLGFQNLGREEKVAWSVPIDFKGKILLIEHRKLGLGVFSRNPADDEEDARQVVTLIQKGVKAAQPFFEWLADRAVQASELNVLNSSDSLFERYEYLLSLYRSADKEATARVDEKHVEKKSTPTGEVTTIHYPGWRLRKQAQWLALATIDAFFSWTEHVFIHIAILTGKAGTGLEIAELAEAEWQTKFKRALDVGDADTKELFDKLIEIRRQYRNFVAHGAFGKQGEAFQFHSGAGAVPVLLPHGAGQRRFAITRTLDFDDTAAIEVIELFIKHLWTGSLKPARLYIQDAALPVILTMVRDGTYDRAMRSTEEMDEFVNALGRHIDDAANMDW